MFVCGVGSVGNITSQLDIQSVFPGTVKPTGIESLWVLPAVLTQSKHGMTGKKMTLRFLRLNHTVLLCVTGYTWTWAKYRHQNVIFTMLCRGFIVMRRKQFISLHLCKNVLRLRRLFEHVFLQIKTCSENIWILWSCVFFFTDIVFMLNIYIHRICLLLLLIRLAYLYFSYFKK